MPLYLLNDPALLALIRSRSRAGAEVLYDQYAKVLNIAIYRMVGQKEPTDIILEKTICKIWDTAEHYNEREQPLLTWMLAIAKRIAKEHLSVDMEGISA